MLKPYSKAFSYSPQISLFFSVSRFCICNSIWKILDAHHSLRSQRPDNMLGAEMGGGGQESDKDKSPPSNEESRRGKASSGSGASIVWRWYTPKTTDEFIKVGGRKPSSWQTHGWAIRYFSRKLSLAESCRSNSVCPLYLELSESIELPMSFLPLIFPTLMFSHRWNILNPILHMLQHIPTCHPGPHQCCLLVTAVKGGVSCDPGKRENMSLPARHDGEATAYYLRSLVNPSEVSTAHLSLPSMSCSLNGYNPWHPQRHLSGA